jgi:hypothetical protein
MDDNHCMFTQPLHVHLLQTVFSAFLHGAQTGNNTPIKACLGARVLEWNGLSHSTFPISIIV